MKERYCADCLHCETVHGLGEVVLICAHRPGFRGLWVAVGERDTCARFRLRAPSSLFELRRDKRDDIRLVPLSQGKFALVDAGDYAAVMAYSWYAQKSYARRLEAKNFCLQTQSGGSRRRAVVSKQDASATLYAVRKEGGRTIRMHREIMKAGPGEVVDHINHDGLDNRRCNLRVCSHAENVRNQRGQRGRSSRYKGVSRDKRGKWRAQIWYNGEHTYLGLFDSETAAAEAYNAKARELFGEFAYLNKVGEF